MFMRATGFEIARGSGRPPHPPSWYNVWIPKGLVKEGLIVHVTTGRVRNRLFIGNCDTSLAVKYSCFFFVFFFIFTDLYKLRQISVSFVINYSYNFIQFILQDSQESLQLKCWSTLKEITVKKKRRNIDKIMTMHNSKKKYKDDTSCLLWSGQFGTR